MKHTIVSKYIMLSIFLVLEDGIPIHFSTFVPSYTKPVKEISKSVQRCSELLADVKLDQNKFWESIGKIGINSNKNKSFPMEIVKGGTVGSNLHDVLNKWKESFKNLYNDDHG